MEKSANLALSKHQRPEFIDDHDVPNNSLTRCVMGEYTHTKYYSFMAANVKTIISSFNFVKGVSAKIHKINLI